MKKYFLCIFMLMLTGSVYAEPISITPIQTISTAQKDFKLGNSYQFKDVKNGDVYNGNITFYRPNGIMGQEAQLEISNFTNAKGQFIPGKVTIIPKNHETLQEFMNYVSFSYFMLVRGSEICLEPNKHVFLINNSDIKKEQTIVTIKPNEEISTCENTLEYSDEIEFVVVNDVYKSGKLYIKSNTTIYGIIDSIDENGWCADNAAIYFKEFKTKDVHNNNITLNADLKIDGFEILKHKSNKSKQFFNYISTFIRGKEVDIKLQDNKITFVLISNN